MQPRILLPVLGLLPFACAAATTDAGAIAVPLPNTAYPTPDGVPLLNVFQDRIGVDPFNLVATLIFFAAIIHTFLAPKFRHWAHVVEEKHASTLKARPARADRDGDGQLDEVSFKGQVLHFFGEVEAVFGIWAVLLMIALAFMKGWHTAVEYLGHRVNFTEPMFVVVIMALASTRPILVFAEKCLSAVASLGKASVMAWWLTLVIVAPLLGSAITEPAAMTIAALLLAQQFYALKPSPRFAYATLGLLFVNVSVGGTLTHFAAPPVLMVAAPWQWDTPFMLTHFGWKAFIGISASSVLYAWIFRKEFAGLQARRRELNEAKQTRTPLAVPAWITVVQLGFMGWTVAMAHYPALFIAGFLFFLAFSQATAHHQSRLDLRPPLLVGFFLASLVVHGGLQGWWIEPVLRRLSEWPLFAGATILTAFNDNAAITFLATQVQGLSDELKFAVVAGAVTGGGLTVIANAPNPAGQSLLQRFFPDGVSALNLFLGALPPTLILGACFMLLG